MSDQQHRALVAQAPAQKQKQARHVRSREPSMQEVAKQTALRLNVTEETVVVRIQQAVWDYGRTQVQALCEETLQIDTPGDDGSKSPAARFFRLVESKGKKKERSGQWLAVSVEQQARMSEVATMIAEQLGEQEVGPRQSIHRSVRILGVEAALALLKRAHEIEESGGMLLPDQSRRRTPGGIYFHLVRQEATTDQRGKIFQFSGFRPRPEQAERQGQQATVKDVQPVAQFSWNERDSALNEAEQERGDLRTVKITLIGRPGKAIERGQCVVMSMQEQAKIPSLPKGLPLPTPEQLEPTRYAVFIALKQWNKVSQAIADPEDVLIVEGWPLLDKQRANIVVFASNVTTKKLQIAAKQPKPSNGSN